MLLRKRSGWEGSKSGVERRACFIGFWGFDAPDRHTWQRTACEFVGLVKNPSQSSLYIFLCRLFGCYFFFGVILCRLLYRSSIDAVLMQQDELNVGCFPLVFFWTWKDRIVKRVAWRWSNYVRFWGLRLDDWASRQQVTVVIISGVSECTTNVHLVYRKN